MPSVKNSNRSGRGRSAIARKAIFNATGNSNGMIPQGYIQTLGGKWIKKNYFGGNAKGGAQPSATGFLVASGSAAAYNIATPALNKNYLFIFKSSNNSAPGNRLTYIPSCNCPGIELFDKDPWEVADPEPELEPEPEPNSNQDNDFLNIFQNLVGGGYLSNGTYQEMYWDTHSPTDSKTYLLQTQSDLSQNNAVGNGLFVRYILDVSASHTSVGVVPASYISNRLITDNKVYTIPQGSNDVGTDPVVLCMQINNHPYYNGNVNFFPNTTNSYIAAYPHDSNSCDIWGRNWWPCASDEKNCAFLFGQGLHGDEGQGIYAWFHTCNTPGAWEHTATKTATDLSLITVRAKDPSSSPCISVDCSNICGCGEGVCVQGAGGIMESVLNSDIFSPRYNSYAWVLDVSFDTVALIYKEWLNNTWAIVDTSSAVVGGYGPLSLAYYNCFYLNDASGVQYYNYIYHDLLDAMLPGVFALKDTIPDGAPWAGKIREECMNFLLSKLITFQNTIFLRSGGSSDRVSYVQNSKKYWGWNELPIYDPPNNSNSSWAYNLEEGHYSLLIYIPRSNELLTGNSNPYLPNNPKTWNKIYDTLDKYVTRLTKEEQNLPATQINFIFATDYATTYKNEGSNNYFRVPLTYYTGYRTQGFIQFPRADPVLPISSFTTKNNNVFILDQSPENFTRNSYVWKKKS